MKNSEGNGKWLIYVRIHVYTYICVQKVSSFRLPVTFDLQLQTRSGFETEQGKKAKESKIRRAPRGKVQVCYYSCASLYKTATTRTTLPSTRQDQGWPSPPCSLVSKEGLIHGQESLFNQWRNALYSALLLLPPACDLAASCGRRTTKSEPEISTSGAISTPPSFIFLSLMAEDSTCSPKVKCHPPHTHHQFLGLLARLALPLAWLPCPTTCLSLAVGVDVRVRPLHRAQFTVTLRILDDRCVAEVVLVPSLNAESSLRPHPPHCLSDVHSTDVLKPGQADVQCTESSWLKR